jgi:hypothetical protein
MRLLIVVGLVLLGLVGGAIVVGQRDRAQESELAGAASNLAGREADSLATPSTSDSELSSEPAPTERESNGPEITEPEEFAVWVADVLLTWDTTGGPLPGQTRQVLLDVADPTGTETPGLVGDLDMHLPDDSAGWADLRRYRTKQWVEVDSAEVSEVWKAIAAAASDDELRPGTAAIDVTGTLYRSGMVSGEHTVEERPARFTVFVLCAPSYETCHLLRLGRPGVVLGEEG